jgi:peptidylprolyl isomerase
MFARTFIDGQRTLGLISPHRSVSMASDANLSKLLRAVAAAATLLGAAGAPAQDVVGKMGNQELRALDMKRMIDAQPPEVRKQLSTDLGAMDRLVRNELVRQSILAEAKQQGWDKKPDVVYLMERARETALLQAYVNSLARPAGAYPSEDEIKGYYEASKDSLTVPGEYQLAQIFVASPESADKAAAAAAQKKVADLAARVQRAPADFGKIAKEASEHKDSAPKGGELGWVPEPQLLPEIRTAVVRMTKGEVSAPIRSAAGWHVVRLIDRKPSVVRPLAEVREQIIATMRLRKAQEVERTYVEGLLSKGAVSINSAELQRLQAQIK